MKTTSAPVSASQPALPPISPELRSLLEDDILRRGVMVPILIAQDGEVIDGRLRQEIAREHGLPCEQILVSHLTDDDRADLRLAVNLYRRHLTQAQVRELIAWELRRRPEESDRCVAKRTGANHRTVAGVRKRLETTGEILQFERRTSVNGKRYPAAPKTVVYPASDGQADEASGLLDYLGDQAPVGRVSLRTLRAMAYKKKLKEEGSKPLAQLPPEIILKAGDFRRFDWSPYEGKTSLVLADPPWLDDHADLREPFAKLSSRLLKPGGVLACYVGQYDLPGWATALSTHLDYFWSVTALNDSGGAVRTRGGKVQSAFRMILVYSKGKPGFDGVLYDVLRSPEKEKGNHPWQQPAHESLRLIHAFTKPGDLIIDPTCGSGSSGCACVIAGQGRRYVGLDQEPEAVKGAMRRISEAVKQTRKG